MQKLNFNECTLGKLERTFKLIPMDTSVALEEWVNTTAELTDFQMMCVQHFCRDLQKNASHWNEYDLSLHFIGPMFSFIGFTEKLRFNLFAQRPIEAEINGILLSGRVDEMVATGFRDPELPFFAINEYKKETDPDGDPAGQALAAMLVSQTLNRAEGNEFPLYGCTIIGSIWRFIVLEDNKYAMSQRFDSAQFNEATQILRILAQLKQYCMARTTHIRTDW
jgi:hypothetical protein